MQPFFRSPNEALAWYREMNNVEKLPVNHALRTGNLALLRHVAWRILFRIRSLRKKLA